jgi:hypothetical protein
MTVGEFRAHMLRNYETSVVDQAYAEMGPRPVQKPCPRLKGKMSMTGQMRAVP